jgi:hypothetical protein
LASEVVVLDSKTTSDIEKEKLGELEIKDGGLSTNCNYEKVIELAKEQAGLMGGNVLLVTQHILPGAKSTCHQIKASVYEVDDPEFYRKEVEWSKERPLKVEDFQGSTEERPFTAATYSGFSYQYFATPLSKYLTVDIRVYFDKKLSYFKRDEFESYVLRHEQVHFDISELYARKFISRAKSELTNLAKWNLGHEELYKEIREELFLEQDRYDSEVYADTSLQAGWTNRIALELDSLLEFEGLRRLEIPRK